MSPTERTIVLIQLDAMAKFAKLLSIAEITASGKSTLAIRSMYPNISQEDSLEVSRLARETFATVYKVK